MKRCLMCACLSLLYGSLALADDPQLDASKLFPAKVGHEWVYAVESKGEKSGTITNKVTKIETIDDVELIRLESFVREKVVASEHVAVTEKGVFRHRVKGAAATPPVCVMRFPLAAGETWKADTKIGQESLTGESVAGFEEVEVPAGKFQTLRVKTNGKVKDQEIESIAWYAEGVGMVQQSFTAGGNTFLLKLQKFAESKDNSKDDAQN